MHCLYCGKGFRLASRIFRDPDFCRPPHRWKFHKRMDLAIRVIQRSSELHPAGQAGFRTGNVALDRAYQSSLVAPVVGEPASVMPRWLLVITGEGLPVELADSAEESMVCTETTDRSAHVERLAALMAQLRSDLDRRRRDDSPRMGPVSDLPHKCA
jgi:hypothetical protein